DSLRRMCDSLSSETTLVSALPVYRDLATGREEHRYQLEAPLRWPGGSYVDRMARVGNEPGRPSYTLFRRDALRMTDDAWRNDMSCDLVANVLAAAAGETVLLPPGLVTCGQHPGRDAVNQSFDLLAARLVHSLDYLAKQSDSRIRRFASIYGVVEAFGLIRTYAGKRRRGVHVPLSELLRHLASVRRAIGLQALFMHPRKTSQYLKYKYAMGRRAPLAPKPISFP
ncbi:MAG: hypothetical protein KBA51_03740, partial [Kiritimatiellae bacterium]|nr:hypothetical protein [Kiritimatiellia bacterium]